MLGIVLIAPPPSPQKRRGIFRVTWITCGLAENIDQSEDEEFLVNDPS